MYVYISIFFVAFISGSVLSGNFQKRVYEHKLNERAQQIVKHQNAITEATNRAVEAERGRALLARQARERQNVLAQEKLNEILANTSDMCNWTDDERMRYEDLYRAYGLSKATPTN